MPPPRSSEAPVRTWHHRDFTVGSLVASKGATTVSVVVPAKDEAATIGDVVGTIHHRCVRPGLVDELVVVDSGSDDGTADLARAAGARVVDQRAVLADAGPGQGKGDALWKGLAATTGDLVCFIDADIEDLDERFVRGLVGPLLSTPEVSFVKAAYDRPLQVDGRLHAGGGRVTEILARPLIAAFWPELAPLAQPLSGEYAGRRELLEHLPMVHGYGVEFALLVDIADRHGVEVIGQVDLDRRIHRNQDVAALGRMAFEILHVALDRLKAQGRADLADVGDVLRQPVRDENGALAAASWQARPAERPPLAAWRAQQGT
ncbi:MAG: glucosyl-3-phosphoglycerate synthase [Nitriliruptorales bacterium]|nr:glucosyl-3-phosphoglycerate synthase [Nitriliruptorales bacterium]